MSYKVTTDDGELIENYISEVDEMKNEYINYNNHYKKYKKVINQLNETWFDVYQQINYCIVNKDYDQLENISIMMKNIYNQFIMMHRLKIDFYSAENLKRRKHTKYITNQINKLKYRIQKI